MGKLRDLFRKRQTDNDHAHDHAHPEGTDPGREREREAPAQTFYKHAGASRSTLSLNLVRGLMLRTRQGEQADKGEDEQDGGRVERLSMASWVTGESEHDFVGPPPSDQVALDDRNAQRQDEQDGITIRSSSPVSSVETITRGHLTPGNDDESYQDPEDAGLLVDKASHDINTRRSERSNQSSTVQYFMASAPATQSAQSGQDYPSIMAENDGNDESSVETSHSPVTTSDSPRSSLTHTRQRSPIAQRTPTQTETPETPETPPAAIPHELPAIEPFSPLRNSMAHLLSDRFGTHPSTRRPRGHQAVTSDYGLAMPRLSSGTGISTPSATTKPDLTPEHRVFSTTQPSRSTRPAPPTHSSLPLHTASKYTKIASSSPASATGLTHDNNGYNQGQRQEHSRELRELEALVKTFESTKQDWKREQQWWKMVSRDQNEVIQMQKEELEALKYGRQRPDAQDMSQSRVWDDPRAAAGAREDQWQLPHQEHRYDYGNSSRLQQGDGDMRGDLMSSSRSRVDRLGNLSTVDEVSEFSESDEHME